MKNGETWKRIGINLAIIAGVIVVMAVAIHLLLLVGTRHGARRTVPEFKGISIKEAQVLAEANELDIFINDSLYVAIYPGGTVLDQMPASGVEVKPGRTIYVVINAYGDRMVEVPYVAGRSLRQAKNMLEVAGLEIENINYVSDMATNYVLGQSYKGVNIDWSSKKVVAEGSGIALTVGVKRSEDPYTLVPNVVGLSLKEAKGRIWESGLNVGRINIDAGVNLLKHKNAKVYIQGTAANTSASWGSTINITMTLDEEKISSAVAKARKSDLEYEKALWRAQNK